MESFGKNEKDFGKKDETGDVLSINLYQPETVIKGEIIPKRLL